jgi:hypothetical protein
VAASPRSGQSDVPLPCESLVQDPDRCGELDVPVGPAGVECVAGRGVPSRLIATKTRIAWINGHRERGYAGRQRRRREQQVCAAVPVLRLDAPEDLRRSHNSV